MKVGRSNDLDTFSHYVWRDDKANITLNIFEYRLKQKLSCMVKRLDKS